MAAAPGRSLIGGVVAVAGEDHAELLGRARDAGAVAGVGRPGWVPPWGGRPRPAGRRRRRRRRRRPRRRRSWGTHGVEAPSGSIDRGVDQPDPGVRIDTEVPWTATQVPGAGRRRRCPRWAGPPRRRPTPSTTCRPSRGPVSPTSAVQEVRRRRTRRPGPVWNRSTVADADPGGEGLGGRPGGPVQGGHVPGVVDVGAELAVGQATAAVRDPGWPGPGSAGSAGATAAGASGVGGDQLVPSPREVWPEPSTTAHSGPVGAGDGGEFTGAVSARRRGGEVGGRRAPGGAVPRRRPPRARWSRRRRPRWSLLRRPGRTRPRCTTPT